MSASRRGRHRHRPRAAADLRESARRPARPARLRDLSAGRDRRGVDRARVDQRPLHDRERSRSRCSWSSTARWPRPSTASRGRRRPAGRSRSSTTSSSEDAPIVLEEHGRSTQRHLPIVSLASARGTLVTGLMWSGAWRMDLVGKPGGRTELTAWLSEHDHQRDADAAGDHAARASSAWSRATSRRSRRRCTATSSACCAAAGCSSRSSPTTPGSRPAREIDEESIEAAMYAAAAAGAELFELDAGWYDGAGERDAFDFASGLGTWRVDKEKFPHGLRAARRSRPRPRHEVRGVGRAGARRPADGRRAGHGARDVAAAGERALRAGCAQRRGAHRDARPRQPRGARVAARQAEPPGRSSRASITSSGTTTRGSTTRGRSPAPGRNDGNFRHVTGLYQVLAALKERFPWLLIENCSGGGNRLDLGLMRYTDAGWMDDRTSPSAHVRHNLQGLTTFLPPAYLLSYLLHDASEPMHDARRLRALRAQPHAWRLRAVVPARQPRRARHRARCACETDRWKALRSLQQTASAVLVSPQVLARSRTLGRHAARLARPGSGGALRVPERYRGRGREHAPARPRSHLRVRRRLGSRGRDRLMTGASLMDDGLELFAAESTRAHLLTFTRVTAEEARAIRARAPLTALTATDAVTRRAYHRLPPSLSAPRIARRREPCMIANVGVRGLPGLCCAGPCSGRTDQRVDGRRRSQRPQRSPAISGDGRFVAFASAATNLVADDTNGLTDIFLRDRDTDADGIFDEAGAVATTRLSVGPGGVQSDGEHQPGDHARRPVRLLHLDGDQPRAGLGGGIVPGLPAGSHDRRDRARQQHQRRRSSATATPLRRRSATTANGWPSSRPPPTCSFVRDDRRPPDLHAVRSAQHPAARLRRQHDAADPLRRAERLGRRLASALSVGRSPAGAADRPARDVRAGRAASTAVSTTARTGRSRGCRRPAAR